jgi:hypothetical protein
MQYELVQGFQRVLPGTEIGPAFVGRSSLFIRFSLRVTAILLNLTFCIFHFLSSVPGNSRNILFFSKMKWRKREKRL